ncbi:MAG TPA: NADH-quinone oxidoreductase subunit N [Anaerolineae bacterium]|nr:NADH-quinone oxidoreductase subunit N [Anaerolineae bacterium]
MNIPGLNLTAIAPQVIIVITALVVLLAELFTGKKSILAYLSLLGIVAAAAASWYLWVGTEQQTFAVPMFQTMAVADGYSLFLNLVFLVTAALSVLVSINYLVREGMNHGEYYALLLLATGGMMLMGSATDLMTVFLALEILSISLYVLAGFNRADLKSGESALKYFLLGAFASGFLLYGIALIYGATGTTSLAAIVDFLTVRCSGTMSGSYLFIGLGLLLVGFSFKIALVPFHQWTPDVYEGAPTSVTAFMSVGAKAAGFAALGRLLLYAFPTLLWDWAWALAALSILTMTLGNLAAIAQTNVKRMLAYSSIAHAGYILIGIIAANEAGMAGVLFYLLAYAFMNVGAFAVVIAVGREGEPNLELSDYAGLGARQPLLAAAMTVFMFSLAGVPPLAGFFGKFYIFSAAVQAGLVGLAVIGVLNSVVSAFFYLRVIVYMYMREPARFVVVEARPVLAPPLALAIALATLGTVMLGLLPAPLLTLAQQSIAMLF